MKPRTVEESSARLERLAQCAFRTMHPAGSWATLTYTAQNAWVEVALQIVLEAQAIAAEDKAEAAAQVRKGQPC